MRKIIQIAISTASCDDVVDEAILALCDDGTVWRFLNVNRGWSKFPSIPQPLSENEREVMDDLLKKDRQEGLDEDDKEVLLHLIAEDKHRG